MKAARQRKQIPPRSHVPRTAHSHTAHSTQHTLSLLILDVPRYIPLPHARTLRGTCCRSAFPGFQVPLELRSKERSATHHTTHTNASHRQANTDCRVTWALTTTTPPDPSQEGLASFPSFAMKLLLASALFFSLLPCPSEMPHRWQRPTDWHTFTAARGKPAGKIILAKHLLLGFRLEGSSVRAFAL